ncbi:MAG: pyridoxal phosphate-dependent aminotransferase [Thermoplasmatales archaeon]|nr:pyridoxal phosphate-dependent aminotransferase [Thermoplasmatales archaeon]MCW6170126.1 pyridoxal phosphate-dependent aminotransferase [Thermoplasmatales archaeon]
MKALEDEMFTWIRTNRKQCRFNLTNSGFSEPDLERFGINTSYEDYRSEMRETPEVFTESVASVYKVHKENVVTTCGGTGGIFIANAYLREKVSKVYVPPIEYMPMFLTPRSLGMPLIFKAPNREDFLSEKNFLFEFTNPNNPTGKSFDQRVINEMISLVEENDSYLYSDETFRPFSMEENPGTLFSGSKRIIVSNTMTKFFGLGNLRVGWMIAEEDVASELNNVKDIVTAEISNYSMWIAAQAIRNRKRFISFAKTIIEKNMQILKEFLALHTELKSDLPDSSSIAYLRYTKGPDSLEFAKKLLQDTGILIVPGRYFNDENGFRICMTSDPDNFKEAMDMLDSYLNDTKNLD